MLDMGTGTGILAILAAMRGAEKVVGVEIDPAAYENAVDNIKLNDTPEVELRLGGAETVTETGAFDFEYAKLLQKSEMRKDIVIELSYKGFG